MTSVILLACVALAAGADAPRPFAITVVDEQTRRGVPLVELRAVHGIKLYTDSAGVAVFDEPGLADQSVFFYVASPGYEFARDGFGFRGKALKVWTVNMAVDRTMFWPTRQLAPQTGLCYHRRSFAL